jgi:hypothetical protein
MDMMGHRHHFAPLIARTPGGVGVPDAVDEAFAPLPSATAVTVGVVDTGLLVDRRHGRPHPWFGDHVSFRDQDIDPIAQGSGDADEQGFLADADGHGTFVTGRILREAPRARVTMWGVLDKSVDGDALGADDDRLVADAVRQLANDPDIQVINLSFGGGVFVDEGVPANLGRVLGEIDPRIAVIAAAGNAGTSDPVWPAAFPRVIAVGAVDELPPTPDDPLPARAEFSNYGRWVRAYATGVGVLGPFAFFREHGTGIEGRPSQHFRGWARWSGTSFAAATVSGRVAQTVIELGVTGAEAAEIVLRESRTLDDDGAAWVRSNG